jgi:hypothetical protein
MADGQFECKCCLVEYPLSERTEYTRHDSPSWLPGVYCCECMKRIHSGAWKIIKEDLLGVDCLAVFRSIQQHGLPTTLVERDVLGNQSYVPLSGIRTGTGPARSTDLDIDITREQVAALEEELRQLDRQQLFADDIKAIAERYWGDRSA